MSLEFTDRLIDWFWTHGTKRKEQYTISTSDWTKNLYNVRKELELVREASQLERPAFAIWGPSQTGKSTLVSSYVDAKAVFVRQEGEDGKGSALHWEGGQPTFFMAPKVDESKGETYPPWINVLNPFNGGRDASACLSRFVYGSLRKEKGAYHVPHAMYPVEVRFVPEKDLLHAIARGYDTECQGDPQAPGRQPRPHTLDSFQGKLDEFRSDHFGISPETNRRAYELLHDLCEVLDDLVFAELPRFLQLLAEGESNWKNVLSSLLAEKVLLAGDALVEEFAAKILWDGAPALTTFYQKANTARKKYAQVWRGKTLHCSLKVAALFLDMDACRIYYDLCKSGGPRADLPPGDKARIFWESIPNLAYKEEGSRVYLGFHPELPNKLNLTAEDYAVLQGLVWELIIPMNPANIPASPFLEFLRRADLLDFPGVGNDKPELAATKPDPWSEKFEPFEFFTKVLKRGKTASIVSTYAKRLTIDGFNIFQNIDQHPPVNPGQLHTGINAWWKSMVPDYYRNQEGPSPLPLNLALCWWAMTINQEDPKNAIVLGNAERIWKTLGKIAHPEVCTTFALNYYRFVRGEIHSSKDFRPGSRIYEKIRLEAAFQLQFKAEVSLLSYDKMAEDKTTGGTDYFFEQLGVQVEKSKVNPRFRRPAILTQKAESGLQELVRLFTEYSLFPPPPSGDTRAQYLEELKQQLIDATEGRFSQPQSPCTEKEVRVLNHVLRAYFDIDYTELMPVPADPAEINIDFIRSQYQKWINSQVERYRRWRSPGAKGVKVGPDWSLLGFNSERQFKSYLEALVASVDPDQDMREMAVWLAKLVGDRTFGPANVRPDLRRHLAVRMANVLVYGDRGIEVYDPTDLGSDALDAEETHEPRGRECPSYQVFMRPLVEQQLDWLRRRAVEGGPITPPELPGEQELIGLLKELIALCPQNEELARFQAQIPAYPGATASS